MLNSRIQDQSIAASLEGNRKINKRISEMVKKEIIDFIEQSGKQIVLDLRGVSVGEDKGISALKAIAELARANNRIFSMLKVRQDVVALIELSKIKKTFIIGKN